MGCRDMLNKVNWLGKEIWKFRLSYLFIAPFFILLALFTITPVLSAIGFSFTYFNSIELPEFIGWLNYQNIFSQDLIFMGKVIPNTFKFALFVGPIGYVLAFLLAYIIAQLPGTARTWFALALYTPSLTAGIAMVVVWQVMFSGDRTGYLNSLLLRWGLIEQPILFVTDKAYLMNIMITVSIWASMGVGFLALLAGILNVDKQLYEAGRMDGIRSRLQEIWYITIPIMKPQMLFAAIMSIVNTLKSGDIGIQLNGLTNSAEPTPDYAGQLILNHVRDYGFIRYELGYACALSVILFIFMLFLSKVFWRLVGPKEGEG